MRPSSHTAILQQSCAITRSCACIVTSMSEFFFVLAACPHAGQNVRVAQFCFTNLVLICHGYLCQKHTEASFIAARASPDKECRCLQSLFLKSTPPLHDSGFLHHPDPFATTYFLVQIRSNCQQAVEVLTRLIGHLRNCAWTTGVVGSISSKRVITWVGCI